MTLLFSVIFSFWKKRGGGWTLKSNPRHPTIQLSFDPPLRWIIGVEFGSIMQSQRCGRNKMTRPGRQTEKLSRNSFRPNPKSRAYHKGTWEVSRVGGSGLFHVTVSRRVISLLPANGIAGRWLFPPECDVTNASQHIHLSLYQPYKRKQALQIFYISISPAPQRNCAKRSFLWSKHEPISFPTRLLHGKHTPYNREALRGIAHCGVY